MVSNTVMAVEETFTHLNRQYSNMSVKRLNDLPSIKDTIVSTGIMGLDIALGVGGIKKGSIVEIYAPESAGKTTLALQLCKQFQQTGKPVLYIDTERTLTRETIESMGIRGDNFYLMHVGNLEMALDVCKTVAASGTFSVIVIDSLAGLAPKAQINGEVGENHAGTFAKIMSDTLPVLTPILDDSGCTLIVINQIREKIGIMFGNPEHSTGGRALKYYASVRIDMRRMELIKSVGNTIGFRIRVKVVKNKIAASCKEAEFDIIFGKGISTEGEVLDLAVKNGIIVKSGSWYSFKGNAIGQGRESVSKYLADNPEEYKKVAARLREISMVA